MSDSWTEYKVVILGLGAVGKSAMTIKFMNGVFIEKYDPTIEDSYRKEIEIDGRAITLDILDTSGQEEYSALRDIYIKGANTFLLVYSIVSRHSWEYVKKMRLILLERKQGDISVVLAGNKCDLESERAVEHEEVETFMLENNFRHHILTSAKTGLGIREVFESVVRVIMHWRINHPYRKPKKRTCVLQ